MGTQSTLTVYDGASTPAVHTLVGEYVKALPDGTIEASWKETVSTVPDEAQIRLITRMKKLPSGVTRCSARWFVPVMESVSGANASGYTAAPKVAYVDSFECVSYSSPRSTIAGRRLVRQLALNVNGAISTSVAAATSGAVVDLHDYRVQVG